MRCPSAVAHGDGAFRAGCDQVPDDGQPEALGGVDVEALGQPDTVVDDLEGQAVDVVDQRTRM